MKKCLVLQLLFLSVFIWKTSAQGRITSEGLYFNNEDLRIEWVGRQDAWNPGEREYEKEWIYFTNKTNNTIRIQYSCKVHLTRYSVDFHYTKTIYVSPNQTTSDDVISNYENVGKQHETICRVHDFKLINYAIQPTNYKVEW